MYKTMKTLGPKVKYIVRVSRQNERAFNKVVHTAMRPADFKVYLNRRRINLHAMTKVK
jgi:hypothetical protein